MRAICRSRTLLLTCCTVCCELRAADYGLHSVLEMLMKHGPDLLVASPPQPKLAGRGTGDWGNAADCRGSGSATAKFERELGLWNLGWVLCAHGHGPPPMQQA